MRIAFICAVRNDWDAAQRMLHELNTALANSSDLESSTWLVDNGSTERPQSWHALSYGKNDLHVLELQGHQGWARAKSAALGYLIFEREECFDAFVFLDCNRPGDASKLATLIESSIHHPESVVLSPPDVRALSWLQRIAHFGNRALWRILCGESLKNSSLILVPSRAAEALCHSCHAGSHLEASIRQLRLDVVIAPGARAGKLNSAPQAMPLLTAASVFRERIFARVFAVSGLLFLCFLLAALSATALKLSAVPMIPIAFIALFWLLSVHFGGLSLITILCGLSSQSHNENRRWTPALDASVLIRSVNRVRREPYSVASG